MRILTADKESIPFTKDSKVRINEVKNNGILYGYNVEVDGVILDTYEDEETAEAVSEHIFKNSNKDLDIAMLNRQLEIL